jgi:hypothetical protein
MLSDIAEEPVMYNVHENQPFKQNSVFYILPLSHRTITLLPLAWSHHPSLSHPEPNYSQVDHGPVQGAPNQNNYRPDTNSRLSFRWSTEGLVTHEWPMSSLYSTSGSKSATITVTHANMAMLNYSVYKCLVQLYHVCSTSLSNFNTVDIAMFILWLLPQCLPHF